MSECSMNVPESCLEAMRWYLTDKILEMGSEGCKRFLSKFSVVPIEVTGKKPEIEAGDVDIAFIAITYALLSVADVVTKENPPKAETSPWYHVLQDDKLADVSGYPAVGEEWDSGDNYHDSFADAVAYAHHWAHAKGAEGTYEMELDVPVDMGVFGVPMVMRIVQMDFNVLAVKAAILGINEACNCNS